MTLEEAKAVMVRRAENAEQAAFTATDRDLKAAMTDYAYGLRSALKVLEEVE
jgi:hypothetical protein